MRAIYLQNLILTNYESGGQLTITGASATHLIKSARIKLNESVLVMNGNGAVIHSSVVSILNRKIELKIQQIEEVPRKVCFDLAIMLPKKSAMEKIIKMAQEIGIRRLIPIISTYSQQTFKHGDRVNKLLESGLIQSNNPYLTEITKPVDLKDLNFSKYTDLYYFSSTQQSTNPAPTPVAPLISSIIIIGPEGGTSPDEELWISSIPKINIVHLDTAILRTPTAVAVSSGYLLGHSSGAARA